MAARKGKRKTPPLRVVRVTEQASRASAVLDDGPWLVRDRPIPMTYSELRAEGRILERREILIELTERMRGSRGWATKAGKLDAHSVLLDFQQWLEGRGR